MPCSHTQSILGQGRPLRIVSVHHLNELKGGHIWRVDLEHRWNDTGHCTALWRDWLSNADFEPVKSLGNKKNRNRETNSFMFKMYKSEKMCSEFEQTHRHEGILQRGSKKKPEWKLLVPDELCSDELSDPLTTSVLERLSSWFGLPEEFGVSDSP